MNAWLKETAQLAEYVYILVLVTDGNGGGWPLPYLCHNGLEAKTESG